MAYNLLEFVPEMDMGNVYKVMKTIEASGDEQSADLVKDIWIKLKKETELNQNQHYAFNILNDVVEKKGRMDSTGSMRNRIFKAANALGIKLPSAMFAAESKIAVTRDVLALRKTLKQKLDQLPGIIKARPLTEEQDSNEVILYYALTIDPKLKEGNNPSYDIHKVVSKLFGKQLNYHYHWRDISIEMDTRWNRYSPDELVDGKGVLLVCAFDYGITSETKLARRYLSAKRTLG